MTDYKENNETEMESDGNSFDLQGLIFEYLAQWKWFVLSIVICLGVAYYYVSTIVPTYSVGASIYLSQDKATQSSAAILGNSAIFSNANIDQTEIAILKSRNNLVKIVDSLGLSYSYSVVKPLRDMPVYGTNPVVATLDSVSLWNLSSPITVMADKSGKKYGFEIITHYGGVEEKRTLVSDSLPVSVELSQGTLTLAPSRTATNFDDKIKIQIQNPNWVAAELASKINIEPSRRSSNILRISCVTPLVREGVDIIKTLVNIYNHDIIAEKNLSAIQTEAFIIDRLALVAGELQDVEKEVEQYRRERRIVTDISSEAAMYFNQTNATDERLAELELQNRLIDDMEKSLAKQDDYSPLPVLTENDAINAMIGAYNKKVAQRSALLEGGTENNPLIQTMQDDINRAKSEIYRGLENARNSVRIRQGDLRRKDNAISGRLSNIPVYERELTGIFREQRIKDNIYNFLLEKREEIALQKTLATPTARFIDNPSDNGLVAPFKRNYMFVALIIGILLPAIILFLRRMIFPIFKDKEDLERATSLPILGEICEAPQDQTFVVGDKASTPIAELFRLVRNNIQFALADNQKKVLLVTSSLSGEGKTFIAANLALTFAVAGKKTVVVGLDIRRPKLAHSFGLDNRAGVTTFLSGQVSDLREILKPSGINDNLYVIPGGPVPPNPNELLMSRRMDEFVERLRKEFDVVVIDSAPVGIISDTYLIAPHSDIQLYVTRANYSTKRCLKVLHQSVSSGRLPNCYVILNAVDITSNSYAYRRYGHYGQYGKYGNGNYGYGYGHDETPTLKSRLKRLKRRIFKK
ncbi:MAG: polysaccharide biosynthesis tyrosine autokinase [Pseudoflavonifractor sp.]|nr:polysaccharide biosynthesis tyrosine autokinase [Pseudoflavonifractor sp.]